MFHFCGKVLMMAGLVFCVSMQSAVARDMSVSEAYRALNHKQTTYDQSRSRAEPEDAKYLDHLFFVTDQVFRYRMMMLNAFYEGRDSSFISTYNSEVDNLLSSFSLIEAPTPQLQRVEDLILSAIEDQKLFFNEWYKSYGTAQYAKLQKNYARHSLVQSSHKKLLQAYGVLKSAYPAETPHNIQSFYDHLCVLDFI